MFYLQTLFLQLWKFGIPPTQVKPSKTNKKKSFIFFPLEIRIFFQVEKKENVQKISFARIICPNSVFLVKNMDFYHKTKITFLTFIKLICKQNVEMITGIIFFFVCGTVWMKVLDGVKK